MSQPQETDYRWTHRPTADDMPQQHKLRRVGPKGLPPAIILSGDVLGIYTHFFRGRTQPCRQIDCEGCAADQQARWHGYLWIYGPRTKTVEILEITAAAITPLDDWFRKHRTLKSAEIRCQRIPAKANGRLYIQIFESAFDSKDLPTPPSLKRTMMNIFGINKMPSQEEPGAEVVAKALKLQTGTDH